MMSDEREVCTSKICACGHILTRTLSLFWCRELTPEICSGSFEYAIYAFLWLVSGICIMVNISCCFFFTFHPLVIDITEEIKLPSTQLLSLIWQRVSTLEGHLQASSIRYKKGIV
jgi:hypothetical protein